MEEMEQNNAKYNDSEASSESSEEPIILKSSWAASRNKDAGFNSGDQEKEEDDDDDRDQEGQFDHNITMSKAEKRQRDWELQDNRCALEHITMIGNYHRHRDWRIKGWEWKQRRQEEVRIPEEWKDDGECHDQGKENDANPTPPPPRLPAHFVHGEDVRIYGTRQNPAAPWPNSLSTLVSDSQWELEHGDQINPLDFAQTHLSGVVPTMPKSQDENGSFENASAQTESLLDSARVNSLDPERLGSMAAKDLPRALLLRCWQRAMDAATFTTLQPGKPNTSLPADGDSSTDNHNQAKTSLLLQERQKPARKRCRDLPLDVLGEEESGSDSNPKHKCRICSLEFDSRDKLLEHSYGTEKQVACSWALIPEKQRSIVSECLEQEVKSQATTLTHLVFTKAKERLEALGETNGDGKRPSTCTGSDIVNNKKPKLLNWSDVVEVLQDSLLSSTITNGDENKLAPAFVTDSLDVHKSMAPLILNQQVLNAASLRLAQRYANAPY